MNQGVLKDLWRRSPSSGSSTKTSEYCEKSGLVYIRSCTVAATINSTSLVGFSLAIWLTRCYNPKPEQEFIIAWLHIKKSGFGLHIAVSRCLTGVWAVLLRKQGRLSSVVWDD